MKVPAESSVSNEVEQEAECIHFFSFSLLFPDLGRHSVGSVLSDRRRERADPNGHRLWHRPSSGTSAQSPGGQSSGMEKH